MNAHRAVFSRFGAALLFADERERKIMPYIENRLVHDADSHLMEMSDCLNPYFEKSLLTRF